MKPLGPALKLHFRETLQKQAQNLNPDFLGETICAKNFVGAPVKPRP